MNCKRKSALIKSLNVEKQKNQPLMQRKREGDGERRRWRVGGERMEGSIACPDNDFASHDHDSQLISLMTQSLYTEHTDPCCCITPYKRM